VKRGFKFKKLFFETGQELLWCFGIGQYFPASPDLLFLRKFVAHCFFRPADRAKTLPARVFGAFVQDAPFVSADGGSIVLAGFFVKRFSQDPFRFQNGKLQAFPRILLSRRFGRVDLPMGLHVAHRGD